MKRNLLCIGLVMAISQVSFAFPAMDAAIKKAANQASTTKIQKQSQNKCANFTGRWVGVCENGSEKSPSEFILKQNGCDRFEMTMIENGQVTKVSSYSLYGGLRHEGDNTPFASYHSLLSLKWSADQQVLQVEGSALVSSPFIANTTNMKISGTMMYDGSELVQFMQVDGAGSPHQSNSCRYQKK